jgi:enoyl-CoA hydratase
MLLTGRTVEAAEAYRLGLLSSVVAPERLMDEATAWARGMAARPAESVVAAKRAVNLALEPEPAR